MPLELQLVTRSPLQFNRPLLAAIIDVSHSGETVVTFRAESSAFSFIDDTLLPSAIVEKGLTVNSIYLFDGQTFLNGSPRFIQRIEIKSLSLLGRLEKAVAEATRHLRNYQWKALQTIKLMDGHGSPSSSRYPIGEDNFVVLRKPCDLLNERDCFEIVPNKNLIDAIKKENEPKDPPQGGEGGGYYDDSLWYLYGALYSGSFDSGTCDSGGGGDCG